MTIISVRDNENSRWKRNANKNRKKNQTKKETNKDKKEHGGTEVIMKESKLNNFIMHLS